jgi:predicted dinucleotide-binding enzyme
MRIGILGGTGPAGSALGARLASVGYDVIIGSPAHNILVVEAFAKFLLSLLGDTSKFLRFDEDGKHSFDVM